MGGSKSTTVQKNEIPQWMSEAAEGLFKEAKTKVTPYKAYDPSSAETYKNPYLDDVLKGTTDEIMRANKIGKQDIADAAVGAGAFGGSRHGIAEAESDRAMYDKIGQISNVIRAEGYDKADATARSEHLREQGYDLDQYSQLAGILSGSPRSTTSTQTEKSGGGAMQAIGGALALAGSIYSDERLKENIAPADGEAILSAFEALPVSDYDYKPEAQTALGVPEQRTGPMAQDYAKVFEEGSDGSRIDIGDMLGKLVAAVQALDQRTKKLAV